MLYSIEGRIGVQVWLTIVFLCTDGKIKLVIKKGNLPGVYFMWKGG